MAYLFLLVCYMIADYVLGFLLDFWASCCQWRPTPTEIQQGSAAHQPPKLSSEELNSQWTLFQVLHLRKNVILSYLVPTEPFSGETEIFWVEQSLEQFQQLYHGDRDF